MFEARQRTAVGGKTWWAVFDTEKHNNMLCELLDGTIGLSEAEIRRVCL